ncbi:QcrA and Rieske domain-containing protein [Pseudonocardia asaccharolytica]|uniref:Iron-sulfur protein n=1 Tax=Pseudonocardia asaccharolytica DSM 44247 = NBRC 16224 TaxID=1123024 RepID=A0A511CZ20_9PSEU|nr:Rieske (2Fe-2S) protein [Pseudonocardia asaccharolytica]GEL17790.1 iron-sulfur protein [Pseudonocardia asaccharolytica DSM 44247 = NBRC 16224]
MSDQDTEPTAGAYPAPLSRRAVVTGAGAAAIGATLAVTGCSTTPRSAAGSGGTGGTGGAGTVLGPTAEVPVGSAKVYRTQGVVVTQAAAGEFAGFSTVCPHQGCKINGVQGTSLICPCHGSVFALDGSVTSGPAASGLAPQPITVNDGEISLA